MCLFISAELCAQGDESGNNPETPLNTNQLETSESSDENADAETSEQVADEERFESEEDPLTEEEELAVEAATLTINGYDASHLENENFTYSDGTDFPTD